MRCAARGSGRGGRVDTVLLQLVERATNFTPHRAGSTGFHLDQHRRRLRIGNRAERARNRDVGDPCLAPQRAKFRDRIGGRSASVETRLDQFRVVGIIFRVTYPNAAPTSCNRDEVPHHSPNIVKPAVGFTYNRAGNP